MKRMVAVLLMACLTICAMKIAMAEPMKQVIPNGRNCVLSEGWIYYRVERTDGMCIYRMKPDGTAPEMVYEGDCLYMSASGGRIFFVETGEAYGSVASINADGTDKQHVIGGTWNKFVIDDTQMWLAGQREGKSGLYCMEMDKDAPLSERLTYYPTESYAEQFEIVDDEIYYVDYLENPKKKGRFQEGTLMKMGKSGGERETIESEGEKEIELLGIRDGHLIYNVNNALYKIKTDGTDKVQLAKGAGLCMDDQWIYYQNRQGLFKTSFDGQQTVLMEEGVDLSQCSTAGDWLFYMETQRYGVPYMMSKDGGLISHVPGYQKMSEEAMLGE